MDTIIETSKLGPVKISLHVIEHFNNHSEQGDHAKGIDDVVSVLQSQEIEKLEVPVIIAQRMLASGDSHRGIEFWVHPDRSMVFIVIPQGNYRLVSAAIERSMDGFVFENS